MITENYVELTPAYGRDYKSAADAIVAFFGGKDWKLASVGYRGTYCSVRDFAPGVTVNLRYRCNTRVAVVAIPATDVSQTQTKKENE